MRRLYQAEPAARERVVRSLTAALESEPDLEFAWLYGSFLSGAGFRDVDVGVHLTAPPEVRFRRGLALAVRLDRETGFPVDVRVLNDAPVTRTWSVRDAPRSRAMAARATCHEAETHSAAV